MTFWNEIQRRNVFKVSVAYLALAWLVVQIADTVVPVFDASPLILRGLIVAFALGFPIVVVCAWVYDLTPKGIIRTPDLPSEQPAMLPSGRVLDFAIICFLSLALVTVVFDQYILDSDPLYYRSIAVLPFQSLSDDLDDEYFADGMTEALTASLAKIESIRVISRTSAMRFKGSDLSLPEIARRLGASAIVEASTQQSSDRVRITVQLIDGETDEHLWSETYDRDISDILTLQSDMAQEIARQIQATITPEEQERLNASKAIDPAAYDAYLRGMQHFSRMTPAELEIAESFFEQALEIDTDAALPLASLGLTWVARALNQIVPNQVAAPLARGYAERARMIDDELPTVHMALSSAAWLEGKLDESEAHARRAAELQPSYPDAWAGLANVQLIKEDYGQAVEFMQRAIELDPYNPFYRNVLATALLGARNCNDVISVQRESRLMFPNLPTLLPTLISCLHVIDAFDEVIQAEADWLRLTYNPQGIAALETGLEEGGYQQAMSNVALVLERQALLTNTGSIEVATHFARAGDREKTIEWLRRGVELRNPSMRNVVNLLMFDLVRDDPRFQALRAQLAN